MARMKLFAVILVILGTIFSLTAIVKAQSKASVALTGIVTSHEEGPMEGVLVTARRAGASFTVTVVSDQQGRYSFPRNRLESGQYALRIRAVGYDLEDPGHVDVAASKTTTTTVDLKLKKTEDLAAQLSNAEWRLSVPGTEKQKFLLQCSTECHTNERIVRSHFNPTEWMAVGRRMGTEFTPEEAQYLSAINLSTVSYWQYPLKTLPRLKGESTHVIVTEYDLPHSSHPHDVTVDTKGGLIWYCDTSDHYLGSLNPQTSKVTEYPIPVIKTGVNTGCRTVEFDTDGNPYISLQSQAGVARFDRNTGEFQIWSVPEPANGPRKGSQRVSGALTPIDGKMWVQTPSGGRPEKATDPHRIPRSQIEWRVQRLDVRTGKWEEPIDVFAGIPKDSPAATRQHIIYASIADGQNNLYFTDRTSEYIGRVDGKTGKVDLYRTPSMDSGPRRLHADSLDRLWFGEEFADKIGMFDPETQKIQEFSMPTPYFGPYDVAMDKSGFVWTGGMRSDHVARMDPKTGKIIEYMLPRETNIRRVEVDNSTSPPSFWAGNNNGSSIVRVEPLD